MERRLLMSFALTFLVIIDFQPLLKRFFPQFAPAQTQTQPQNQNQPQSQNQPQTSNQPMAKSNLGSPSAHPGSPASSAARQASAESETVVENDLYRITFSNRGAQVKSWILKKF